MYCLQFDRVRDNDKLCLKIPCDSIFRCTMPQLASIVRHQDHSTEPQIYNSHKLHTYQVQRHRHELKRHRSAPHARTNGAAPGCMRRLRSTPSVFHPIVAVLNLENIVLLFYHVICWIVVVLLQSAAVRPKSAVYQGVLCGRQFESRERKHQRQQHPFEAWLFISTARTWHVGRLCATPGCKSVCLIETRPADRPHRHSFLLFCVCCVALCRRWTLKVHLAQWQLLNRGTPSAKAINHAHRDQTDCRRNHASSGYGRPTFQPRSAKVNGMHRIRMLTGNLRVP